MGVKFTLRRRPARWCVRRGRWKWASFSLFDPTANLAFVRARGVLYFAVWRRTRASRGGGARSWACPDAEGRAATNLGRAIDERRQSQYHKLSAKEHVGRTFTSPQHGERSAELPCILALMMVSRRWVHNHGGYRRCALMFVEKGGWSTSRPPMNRGSRCLRSQQRTARRGTGLRQPTQQCARRARRCRARVPARLHHKTRCRRSCAFSSFTAGPP